MWSLAVSEEVSVKQEPDTLSDQSQFTDLQTLVPVSMPPLPSFQSESYPSITISELTSPDSSCYITSSLGNINNSLEQGR